MDSNEAEILLVDQVGRREEDRLRRSPEGRCEGDFRPRELDGGVDDLRLGEARLGRRRRDPYEMDADEAKVSLIDEIRRAAQDRINGDRADPGELDPDRQSDKRVDDRRCRELWLRATTERWGERDDNASLILESGGISRLPEDEQRPHWTDAHQRCRELPEVRRGRGDDSGRR